LEPIKPITCFEALQRLEDYLDRELSPHDLAVVEAHLEVCDACAREFAFEESLIAGIRSRLRRAALPEGLRGRLSALLAQARTRPPGA
jgi:anti-sigma factor (TIGR02949 family)